MSAHSLNNEVGIWFIWGRIKDFEDVELRYRLEGRQGTIVASLVL